MIESAVIAKLLAKPVIKETMPIFKAFKDNVSHLLDDGFLEYFSNSLDKYKDLKTLLHRQPTGFYDIYYPTSLTYKEEVFDTNSVKKLFNNKNFITIIGDAGSGKSTLLKHLFITTFLEAYKAPILVNLRDLDIRKSDLEIFIRENILNNNLSPSDNHLTKLLKNGDFLFFLDGYDEIKSEKKHDITLNLESFIDKYPKNSYLLTSRPYSNIEYFKSFHNYQIKNLEKKDQVLFVQKQIKDERLSQKIIESIQEVETKHFYIESFLENSLLLTLYIMAYSKNSSIPSNKYIFYRRVFDVLFAEHDSATKIGFEREIKTQLNQESLEDLLKKFSFLSFFENKFDFKKDYIVKTLNTIKDKNENIKFRNNDFIEDMKLSIGLWVEDCGVFSFSHRSLQEYFASVYVSNISSLKNKKTVYERIIKFSTNMNFNINNFLSLCYEMDREFFIEFYSLPIISRTMKLFVLKNGELNYEFPYMNAGFTFSGNDNGKGYLGTTITTDLIFLISSIVTPDINFHSAFSKISNIFSENFYHDKFSKFIKIESGREDVYLLPLKNNITDEYIDFLKDIKMDNAIGEIIQELSDVKKGLEAELRSIKNIEDNFITLI